MDILPKTAEGWIIVSVACLISFAIGQWLRARRKRNMTDDDYIDGLKRSVLAEAQAKSKKAKKKSKKTNKKKDGDSKRTSASLPKIEK